MYYEKKYRLHTHTKKVARIFAVGIIFELKSRNILKSVLRCIVNFVCFLRYLSKLLTLQIRNDESQNLSNELSVLFFCLINLKVSVEQTRQIKKMTSKQYTFVVVFFWVYIIILINYINSGIFCFYFKRVIDLSSFLAGKLRLWGILFC